MLNPPPCNTHSGIPSESLLSASIMSEKGDNDNRQHDLKSEVKSETKGDKDSTPDHERSEERRDFSDDDNHSFPPIKIEFQAAYTDHASSPEQGLHIPSFDVSIQGGRNADFPLSPYMIEASDSNVQVGSIINASMDALTAAEVDSAHEDRLPAEQVETFAHMSGSVAPPAPPDHLFAESWWNSVAYSVPYTFEYVQHEGYQGQNLTPEFPGEPPTPVFDYMTRASRPHDENTDDSSLDRKPAASASLKNKGKAKAGKQSPKKKKKPGKIRPRAQRTSNGSSSSSSTNAGRGGAKPDVGVYGRLEMPDSEELREATTDRARQALNSWHERLNDLIEFRREHGHSKFRLWILAAFANRSNVGLYWLPQPIYLKSILRTASLVYG